MSGKVINDKGILIEYWAQYGPTTAYGLETEHEQAGVGAYELATVSPRITGLQRATTYHFRVCAQDESQGGGPRCGEDARFTTQSAGCGETVTSDIKLTGDLDCFFRPGFVIGADGVDINLAGHAMFGGIASGGGGPTGIDNGGGYDDLTLRNGTVGGFGFGIETKDASRNQITNVTAGAAGNAVTIEGGQANEIRHSDLFGRSFGIQASGSDGLVVADTNSSGGFGDGLRLNGDLARIVRNRFVRSSGGPVVSGLQLVGSGAHIVDNHVEGDWPAGGIVVSGSNNLLTDNVVSGVTDPGFPDEPSSFGDGIFVGVFSSGAVLRRNRADQNGGDGIDVRTASARLEGNAGFDNGGWGILAVPGVTDLGGNTGGGNGVGQCRNVFCP